MQFGPLFNIHVYSYLSAEALDASVEDPYSIGQSRHFDICMFRNSELIGSKPFELIQSNEFLLKK